MASAARAGHILPEEAAARTASATPLRTAQSAAVSARVLARALSCVPIHEAPSLKAGAWEASHGRASRRAMATLAA
jgi:hypothetical protein